MKIDDLKKGLKETSFSKSHQEYMTYSKMKVIDFDEFKNQYVSENKIKSEGIKSNDALYFGRDKDYFIEFKNGKITNEIVFDIRKKIYDSILIFCDYYSKTLKDTREKMEYILVYDCNLKHPTKFEEEKSDKKFLQNLMANSNSEIIKFGLRDFESYFFKNVHTYSKEEFEEKFVKRIENGM